MACIFSVNMQYAMIIGKHIELSIDVIGARSNPKFWYAIVGDIE